MAPSTTPWKRLSGELAHSRSRDFERRVLPLLRLRWPTMIQSAEQDIHDRSGIDLFTPSDTVRFPCAVQCKGFYSSEALERSHLSQIQKSIEDFRTSKFAANKYILVHNRDRDTPKIRDAIASHLDRLQSEGRADSAEVWGRDRLLDWADEELERLLVNRIRDLSTTLLRKHTSVFRFGDVFLTEVPFSTEQIRFRRAAQPEMTGKRARLTADISDGLLGETGKKWKFLVGLFGAGKTTTALRAASHRNSTALYIRCEDLSYGGETLSTNLVLRRFLQTLPIFDDVLAQDRDLIETLAGPVLRRILSRHDSPFALILDGLDENRFFATPRGLAGLASMLSELTCPIILTTREGHFRSCISDLGDFVQHLSRKGGASVEGKLIELHSWTDNQVMRFLDLCSERGTAEEQIVLARIRV